MSSTPTNPYPPVLVRADEAEHLDLIGHVLLADSSATAGALSSHRVVLGRGADGAVPHRHDSPAWRRARGARPLCQGADLMHPLAVGPASRFLTGCDDRTAQLADLSRGVRLVVAPCGAVFVRVARRVL